MPTPHASMAPRPTSDHPAAHGPTPDLARDATSGAASEPTSEPTTGTMGGITLRTCRTIAFNPSCPHRLLLDQVTDKWSVLILTALDEGPARFNAIKRQLGGVTQKALAQSLRRLERNGLVARRVIPASPVAVEYRITPLARTLLPPMLALYRWTVDHLPAVDAAREAYDARRLPDPADD